MNARRERFCLEYAASGNATQAAISAGYSSRTARSQGQRLLTNADIQGRIRELAQETRKRKIADVETVQTFWTAVIRDPAAKMADRLKASELLARSRGAFFHPGVWEDEDGEPVEPGGDVIIYLLDNGRNGGREGDK